MKASTSTLKFEKELGQRAYFGKGTVYKVGLFKNIPFADGFSLIFTKSQHTIVLDDGSTQEITKFHGGLRMPLNDNHKSNWERLHFLLTTSQQNQLN